MTADDMPPPVQLADLVRVQKPRAPDPIRGNKEMAAPAMLLQHARDGLIGTHAAVVEGERYLPAADRRRYRFQVPGELLPVARVEIRPRARKSAGRVFPVRPHVVKHERKGSQRRHE